MSGSSLRIRYAIESNPGAIMTSSTTENIGAELHQRIRELTDRAAISDLIDRYTILLDTQDEKGIDEDWPGSIFVEDCRLTYPIGGHSGLAGLAGFHDDAKQKFTATHHLSSNHVIALAGDRANIRFQMVATHVHRAETRSRAATDPGPLFQIGGYYEGESVRTADGWRFDNWTFHVVWTAGVGPADIAAAEVESRSEISAAEADSRPGTKEPRS
ncbi:nuclear transport factor 2 family protein [Streptomyces sp. A5-4]|uniref:nuclear transport factor 2 family protein n=1 Tax=Streptomyces sp. A5-4 TaxID=3384771 RepID=UPI003DAA364C